MVGDIAALNAEYDSLFDEIQVVVELVDQCIKENSVVAQSQEEYNRKYNRLARRYETALARLKAVDAERIDRAQRARAIRAFIAQIEKQPLAITEWDEELWVTLLETATVHADNRISFRFKDGTDIEVGAE